MTLNTHTARPVGDLLREWRQRRRMSQLHFAAEAEISAKHLSFLETGRARPSREMILHLAERLDIPLHERNRLLTAAGFAPIFPERALADPGLQAARRAIEVVLKGHEPYPAIAIDRHWTLVASNDALPPLLAGIDAALLRPPVNVLRLSLNPAGLAPRIENLGEWRAHLFDRLRRQIDLNADPKLAELMAELQSYRVPASAPPGRREDYGEFVVPLRLRTDKGTLSFFSTTTVFGTPVDVTLSELAIESFFPADAETAETLQSGKP